MAIWLLSPSTFSLSSGTQTLIEEGNLSLSQEKPLVYEQQTITEDMQRLLERSAKDPFSHEATSWMDLVHQLDVRTRGPATGYPAVVMMESTHDRTSNYLVACILRGRDRVTRFRNLVRNPLKRPCLVNVSHIRIQDAPKLLFLKNQSAFHFAHGLAAFRAAR